MPTFELQGPDGKSYEVEAPHEQAAVSAFQQFNQPSNGYLSHAGDVAKSLGTGLVKGAAGLAGMPGDLDKLIGMGVDYAAGKLGATPEDVQRVNQLRQQNDPGLLPGSQTITSGIEAVTGPLHEPQSTAAKYAETVGEFVPGMMVGPGGGGLINRAASAIIPGVASEAAGQATAGTAAEPYARAGAGIAGMLVNPSRFITPNPISAERKAAIDTLENAGVDLSAGQKTGRLPLRYAESALASVPGASAKAAELETRQGEQFTKAVLSKVGEDATHATPEVMDRAFSRIGNQFDTLAARNTLGVDTQFGNDIAQVQRDYHMLANPLQKQVVDSAINDIIGVVQKNNGVIPGDVYQAMRSRLDKAARSSLKSDSQLSDAMFGLKNSLDDAMERSIATANPADLGAWRDVRNQYRNMLVVEKAASGAGEKAAEGIISPSALRNATVAQSRRAYVRGQGDFADLARSGEQIMRPLPNSGTGQRNAIMNYIEGASALAGAGLGGSMGGMEGGVLGLLMGEGGAKLLGAPMMGVASRGVYSKPMQAYLANQLINGAPGISPQSRALLTAQMLMKGANGNSGNTALPIP